MRRINLDAIIIANNVATRIPARAGNAQTCSICKKTIDKDDNLVSYHTNQRIGCIMTPVVCLPCDMKIGIIRSMNVVARYRR